MINLINEFCSSNQEKPGSGQIYRGFYPSPYILYNTFASNFDIETIYNDAYQQAYSIDEELTIIEYTEGDIAIVVCSSLENYEKEKSTTIKFYKNL